MVGSRMVSHPDSTSFEVHAPSSIELNLLNSDLVIDYIERLKPDCVIHLAGKVGGIQANIRDPQEFLCSNVLMGINVLRACSDVGVTEVINFGSSCMYPVEKDVPLSVESLFSGRLEPTNEAYAQAKLTVAMLAKYLDKLNGQSRFVTLIPCNLYGPGDHFESNRSHLIAAIISKIHNAKLTGENLVEVWGSGDARREFLFVDDLVDCVWGIVDRGLSDFPAYVNIGCGFDRSVIDYYQITSSVLGYEGRFVTDVSKPEGVQSKLIDSSWINSWGWFPRTSIEEGLVATYDYFLGLGRNE